jgi:hypothetical protein
MASLRFSRVAIYALDGRELDELPEWEPALLVLPVKPEEWASAGVRRHDGELPIVVRKIGDEAKVVAEWPRSGTGHYSLVLVASGERMHITARIRPRKISDESYSQLLDDLETHLPASVAIALQRLGAMSGIKLLPPSESTLAQELVRLRRAISGFAGRPGLARTLPAIASDPHQVLISTDVWVAREQARRIHPASLARAFSAAHNVEADRLPRRVPELRVEHTADVYENRLVKMFHAQVDRRLRRLVAALELRKDDDLRRDAAQLMRDLRRARHVAHFLDDVASLSYLPDHLTMVLLRRSDYRAALEGYLDFRRSAHVRLEEPALEAPLENLPALYETWGTLQVILALLDVAGSHGFTEVRQQLATRESDGVFLRVLKNGDPAVVLRRELDHTTVRLTPQRAYGRRGKPLRSVSFSQTPDIAIEVDHGDETHVLLFDPKYKLDSEEASALDINGRPKKVDIDKMHAYRDAIRTEAGDRVVDHAAILYPGPLTTFGPGLEALPALPGSAGALEQCLKSTLNSALASAIPLAAPGISGT